MKSGPMLNVAFRPFRYSRFGFTHINYISMLLLTPSLYHGVRLYGVYALRVVAASISFCILWDMLLEKLFRRPSSIGDGSAAMAGMLLGMLLPPLVPWWIIFVGAGAAMFLGKQLFGGAGGSPFNAVCIGWAVVTLSWPQLVDPTYGSVGLNLPFDIEYPLSELRRQGADVLSSFGVARLLAGRQPGSVGAGAPLLLYLGGLAGVVLGIIPWIIPAAIIGAIAFTAALFTPEGISITDMSAFHLLTGFSCIGAFFLAADFSSRPVSRGVMIWYGCATGVLTVALRMWSLFPEGMPFALLIVNMTIPLLDRGKPPQDGIHPEVRRI